jgi:hypothetical protein
MPCVDREPQSRAEPGGLLKGSERFRITIAVRVLPSVQLDCRRTELTRTLHGVPMRRDEETGANSGVIEPRQAFAQSVGIVVYVEPSFRRDLLASLWDERYLVRPQTSRNRQHLVRARHLEVEDRCNRRCELLDIGVLNVPSIFAEMRRDSVGADLLAQQSRRDWIRFDSAPGLPDGRDVIDVDVQPLVLEHDYLGLAPSSYGDRMKLTALTLASITMVCACATSPSKVTTGAPMPAVAPAGNTTGAADARGAVSAFLDAAKSQDLQALAAIWGSAEGSVRDTGTIPRDEMEKRELVMLCYLTHDTYQILSDAPAPNNERVIAAQLKRGTLARTANFFAVAGPGGRWYVRTFDMESLTDFCRSKGR